MTSVEMALETMRNTVGIIFNITGRGLKFLPRVELSPGLKISHVIAHATNRDL